MSLPHVKKCSTLPAHGARGNRTMQMPQAERARYRERLVRPTSALTEADILGRTICGDVAVVLPRLPDQFVDLLILDPPYNLTKDFGQIRFHASDSATYLEWVESWLAPMKRLLKPHASVYFCSTWEGSVGLPELLQRHFKLRNRISWEREKGRGALRNWKCCSEDIWFCTLGAEYVFNVEAVKLKRRVLAPYRDKHGLPKDWVGTEGGAYRLTYPSNLWTDISVPFWSMPENTPHPTQKPEKLVAKLVLASSREGDVIFDPFLGSGTTSVAAKKLGRQFVGIEADETYCCFAEKRLQECERGSSIQGYADGVFWERNSVPCSGRPRGDQRLCARATRDPRQGAISGLGGECDYE